MRRSSFLALLLELDPSNPDTAYYGVRPHVALSWGTATEIGETITRWKFDRSD